MKAAIKSLVTLVVALIIAAPQASWAQKIELEINPTKNEKQKNNHPTTHKETHSPKKDKKPRKDKKQEANKKHEANKNKPKHQDGKKQKNTTKDKNKLSKEPKTLLKPNTGNESEKGSDSISDSYSMVQPDVEIRDVSDTIIVVNGVSFKMIGVKGGTFTMGATAELGVSERDDNKPHRVKLSSFYIGETEVTQELWKEVMGCNPSKYNGGTYRTNLKRPVECVSWDDCRDFIKALNKMTGLNFRLPTEAEWEYAARGGIKSKRYRYAGSNMVGEVAWFHGSAVTEKKDSLYAQEVAKLAPNELGIFDMSGSVCEWCYDKYGKDYYKESQLCNPKGPDEYDSSEEKRVTRGGCRDYSDTDCIVSERDPIVHNIRDEKYGFRLAL